MTVRDFRNFRREFIRLISLNDFGELRGYGPRQSPESSELIKTGLISLLQNRHFLHDVHKLAMEAARLEKEQPKVRKVAKVLRPDIIRCRNAQKRLQSTLREPEQFKSKYGDLVESRLAHCIDTAIENVATLKDSLARWERIYVSKAHLSNSEQL